MVEQFRALGCTRLSIALREGPYDWDALEAFAVRDRTRALITIHTTGGTMLNPGDKAPDFVGRDHNGNTVKLAGLQGQDGRALVLSQGRHAWLNGRGLRVPRPEGRLRPEERGDPGRVVRHPRRQQEVRREVPLQLPAHLRHRPHDRHRLRRQRRSRQGRPARRRRDRPGAARSRSGTTASTPAHGPRRWSARSSYRNRSGGLPIRAHLLRWRRICTLRPPRLAADIGAGRGR